MNNLEIGLRELDKKELRIKNGGFFGVGPLSWRPMIRAGLLSRTLFMPNQMQMA